MIILKLLAITFIFTFLFFGIRVCVQDYKYQSEKLRRMTNDRT